VGEPLIGAQRRPQECWVCTHTPLGPALLRDDDERVHSLVCRPGTAGGVLASELPIQFVRGGVQTAEHGLFCDLAATGTMVVNRQYLNKRESRTRMLRTPCGLGSPLFLLSAGPWATLHCTCRDP
jgi:hypothetical protein